MCTISDADGWNDHLVRQLTLHRKFPQVVRAAADTLMPALRALPPGHQLVFGIRCNGGKQRSVGFARMLVNHLQDEYDIVVRAGWCNEERFCGCADCARPHGAFPAVFDAAMVEFGRFWPTTQGPLWRD